MSSDGNPTARVAVLDDDEQWCFAIARFLRADYEVKTFTDIQSFLDSPINTYDLVIVDFAIAPTQRYEKSVSGIDVINQLKAQLTHPPLTILTSAFISRNDLGIDRALGLQADAVMPKDCGLDEIFQKVRKLLESRAS